MSKKINTDVVSFHPGYYISEIIDDMDITQEEFAVRLGTSAKTISKLINGEANISKDLAMKLSNMLKTSPDMWLNLQKKYDVQIIERNRLQELESQKDLVREIDYNYFVKLNLLPAVTDAVEKIQNLCSYLSISKLSILTESNYNVSFRNGIKSLQQKNILSANVWVETATKISRGVEAKSFDEKKLRVTIEKIADMTAKNLEEVIQPIKESLAECGVVLVMLPYLKNSGLHGVVKWLNKDKVLVAISDRRKYIDTFWFTFFHEIGHVFQKRIKDISYTWEEASTDELEKNADKFAEELLIPEKDYNKFLAASNFTQFSIISFSNEINRDPGIVVGRLQNDKKIPHYQFNSLRSKIPESCFKIN